MKHILLLIIFHFLSFPLQAQQLPVYEGVGQLAFSHNPAMTAALGGTTFGLVHRQSWVGFDDSPTWWSISAQHAFDNMSVGLSLVSDKVGAWTQNSVQAAYAYQLRLGKRNAPQLSIGLSGGWLNSNFNLENIIAAEEADPLAISGISATNALSLAGGIYFTTINRDMARRFSDNSYPGQIYFFAGLSGKHVLFNSFITDNATYPQRVWHGNAMGGAYFVFDDNYFFVKPSFWVDYTHQGLFSPVIQCQAGLTNSISAGFQYRLHTGFSFQLNLNGEFITEKIPFQITLLFIPQSKQKKGSGIGGGFSIVCDLF